MTRDVIIIEKGHENMPSKTEKVEMERKGRVISGFDYPLEALIII